MRDFSTLPSGLTISLRHPRNLSYRCKPAKRIDVEFELELWHADLHLDVLGCWFSLLARYTLNFANNLSVVPKSAISAAMLSLNLEMHHSGSQDCGIVNSKVSRNESNFRSIASQMATQVFQELRGLGVDPLRWIKPYNGEIATS